MMHSQALAVSLKETNDKKHINMIRNSLFHRVNPQRDKLWDPMSIELFDKCISYISRKYDVVQFEELAFSDKYINPKKKWRLLCLMMATKTILIMLRQF